ncbi:amidohydrolase [Brachybacterium endophyticum]|uniref:Amidohydrolase n=1 Tax=Brachybacterium endophyticum TaxID=2182385 RepID=A0A2U2RKL2_9MICO|nr:amidohydrolase family protein [Brachybacterium endophyticum]PWH06419.1 amidohydrolase [Brachybacterium endophyticum]
MSDQVTVIEGARVFTGEGLSEPQDVVIVDGTIGDTGDLGPGGGSSSRADGSSSRVNGRGKVLLPGLIDSHMHTLGRQDLDDLAAWGVTTGLDMAAWPAEHVREMRELRGTTQMLSAMTPAVGPGGNHARMPGFPAGGILTAPEQARGFVETRIADGADYIKIVTEAEPPEGMAPETVRAIVEAAHAHGLLVVAHSVTTGAFHVAIDAGVDISTHAPLDDVLDEASVDRMAAQRMVSSPTLTMMRGVAGLRADQGLRYDAARASVSRFHDHGIRLLAGTDANSAPGAPFAPRHGESMHDELELLVEAGLTPLEVLRSATSLPAQTFGLEDRGVIAPGKRADLLLVDGDPTTDITATRGIAGVWIAGERIR